MKFSQLAGLCLTALSGLASAAAVAAVPDNSVVERATADSACSNGPFSRACWKNGYSIATDFDQKFPTTGKTVSYSLTLTNGTCNPDGNGERICLLVNNQYPGPLIRASWGDTLSITVNNQLQDNGTSIHWHGVRQYHSSGSDGVGGITECPIAPGSTKTYTFQVTQFGTSWYHSHFSNQYGDGVVGPMIFDGPASANYDLDLGTYMVSDWYYQTAFQFGEQSTAALQRQSAGPAGNNILINGTNKNANGGGSYNQVTITSGKKYRLRLINTSMDNMIRVSLDNHMLQVMTSDFIPIKPYYTQWVLLAIGQRYDVVVNANQTAGNYYFRANVATDCLSGNEHNGLAIWSYSTVKSGTPTSNAYPEPSVCAEATNLAPYWVQPVPSGSFVNNQIDVNITKQVIVPNGDAIFVWAIGDTSMDIAWNNPTMSYLMEGNTSYPADLNVLPTTSEGNWNYWLIQAVQGLPPVPHPIHLHGHDFFVIGAGSGQYDASTASLNWATPPRRDTALLPGGGWLALAFASNNPGSWLMHCHIAAHIGEGLGLQFVESPSSVTFPDQGTYNSNCDAWRKYEPTAYYKKSDSGL